MLWVWIVSRDDFVEYGKHSKAIKDYVEKVEREGSSSKQSTPKKAGKVDKATAAFKVDTLLCLSRGNYTVLLLQAIDSDHSGFVDREEFLKFTR